MSVPGGGYGGPTRFDDHDPLSGDDGTYDPPLKWTVVLIIAAGCAIAAGGVPLPTRTWTHWHWLHGPWIVATAVATLVGTAAILVARFLLPNVFRNSYAYQYVAVIGVILSAIGVIGFIVAGLLN